MRGVVALAIVAWGVACADERAGQMAVTPDPRPNGTGGVAAVGGGPGQAGAGISGTAAGSGSGGRGTAGAGAAGGGVAGVGAAGGGAAGAGAAGVGAAGVGAAGAGAGGGGASVAGHGGDGSAGRISAGTGGAAAGSGGASAGAGGRGPSAGMPTPVLRVPLRVHTARSELTPAQLTEILAEVNEIWLTQAGICFEIEVTASEENIGMGIDLRYTSGNIPNAAGANGLAAGQHDVWTIDRPNLGAAPNPVRNPTARTSAHELGHILDLDHQNPPPSQDCSTPCRCVVMNLNCDDFLMRSGRSGFFLSSDEVTLARRRAEQLGLKDTQPLNCSAPRFAM